MEEYEVDLRDYLEVVWKRKWIIILVTVVALGIAAAYSYTRPSEYRSSGVYELIDLKPENITTPGNGALIKVVYKLVNVPFHDSNGIEVFTKKELESILNSRNLVQMAVSSDEFNQAQLTEGTSKGMVSWVSSHLNVRTINSELVEFEIEGPKNPERLKNILIQMVGVTKKELAKRIVNQIERTRIREIARKEILTSDKAKIEDKIANQISSLQAEYQEDMAGLKKKLEEIETNKKYRNVQVGEQKVTMSGFTLREHYRALNDRLSSLKSKLQELNVTPRKFFPYLSKRLENIKDEITQIDRSIHSLKRLQAEYSQGKQIMEPIDSPYVSYNPVGPNRRMNIAVAGVLGVFLGTLLAFFVEYMSKPREDNK